jgi:hypothetical protein
MSASHSKHIQTGASLAGRPTPHTPTSEGTRANGDGGTGGSASDLTVLAGTVATAGAETGAGVGAGVEGGAGAGLEGTWEKACVNGAAAEAGDCSKADETDDEGDGGGSAEPLPPEGDSKCSGLGARTGGVRLEKSRSVSLRNNAPWSPKKKVRHSLGQAKLHQKNWARCAGHRGTEKSSVTRGRDRACRTCLRAWMFTNGRGAFSRTC